MIKISDIVEDAVAKVINNFPNDVIEEVKLQKDIDTTEIVDEIRKLNFHTVELTTNEKSAEVKEDPYIICEFVYSTNYNSIKLDRFFKKGNRCTANALVNKKYCVTHKNTRIKKEREIKVHTRDIEEYYPDEDNELEHILDNVYVNKKDVIILKNKDTSSSIRWFLISKSKTNQEGKRTFTKFISKVLEDLKTQKIERNYNYEVNAETYKGIKTAYEIFLEG